MAFEKPPILTGTPAQQCAALRDYLFRMAKTLEKTEAQNQSSTDGKAEKTAYNSADKKTEAEIRKNAQNLRELIIKTADEVKEYADSKVEDYNSLYVAKSDFGTFSESIESRIETTARGVVEGYHYQSAIDSQQDSIDLLQNYMSTINGEIRRGIIADPTSGEEHLGIAISENAAFTGEQTQSGGSTYYRIAPGQTFGLYTSTGWQFWVNGARAGWLDSTDGMLHVANILVENTLQLGPSWAISTSGGFGIRYIGQ